MKKFHIRVNWIYLTSIILICIQCSTIKMPFKQGDANHAIINAIHDFQGNHSGIFKKDDVFYIIIRENASYYDLTIINLGEKQYLYNPKVIPNDNSFPNNYYVLESKLFIWYDDLKTIDESTINTYLKYNLLVDNENDTIFFIDNVNMDDSKNGVSYLFCKNDLTKFKKYKNRIGQTSSSKLKCI